jgi:D-sedoheptulose 7-phosphate isomerase
MREMITLFYDHLKETMSAIVVTRESGEILSLEEGIEAAIQLVTAPEKRSRRIFFIGNGASAAISSHMASDYTKAGGLKAHAFNDGALLTCIGNDFGYQHIFEKPVEFLADPGDFLFAISSSGNSVNIHNGIKAAREKQCTVITFSGFKEENPLRILGDLNFYVPSNNYGTVEILHHSICHCILDVICENKKSPA